MEKPPRGDLREQSPVVVQSSGHLIAVFSIVPLAHFNTGIINPDVLRQAEAVLLRYYISFLVNSKAYYFSENLENEG